MNPFRFSTVLTAAFVLGLVAAPKPACAQRPLGIDTSHYDGVINWTNVATNAVFAWTKGTEGLTYVDPTFVSNVLAAKAAGVPMGLYHFAHPETHIGLAGADAEAAFFWSTVSNYVIADGVTLMPSLDYETVPGGSYTAATSSAWVNEWCQDIVNFGLSNGVTIVPVVYTYTSFATSWFDTSATNWPLWMASPNGRNPLTRAPSSTGPWPTWQFWQYGGTNIAGIPAGGTDADVFNGTTATLSNYIVRPSPPTITAQPTNITVLEGGSTAFSVAAFPGPLTYQWKLGGSNVAGATGANFVLTNAYLSTAGNYTVVVTDTGGSTTSSNAALTVIPMITNVAVIPRPGSAIVTWTTSTNANGQAAYGIDTNYGEVMPLVPALTTQHSTLLVGLQPATTYYLQLTSSNAPFSGKYMGSFSTDVSLILQASQAFYSGVWTVDSAAPDKYSPFYEYASTANGSDTGQAMFRPNIVTSGRYNVYLWYSAGANRSQIAPVTVGYQRGSIEDFIDETTNGGSWQLLIAGVPFAAGTNGYIRLGNGSGESGRVVIADAVRLVYTAGQDLPVNNAPPAWWLNYYFGTNSVNPAQDADGDGYSAYAEYVAGTAPNDATSYLHVRGQGNPDGSVQVIFSPCLAGRQYQLQSRVGVTNGVWANLPVSSVTTNANGEGVLTATNLAGAENFLRVSVLLTQ